MKKAALITALLAYCHLSVALAQVGAPPIELSSDPDVVVIEFDIDHDMIAEQPNDPLLRIYGDGRAVFDVPPYMVNGGRYERQLGRAEVQRMVEAMAAGGLLEFDATALGAQRAELLRRRAELYHISDDTHTNIRVQLERYGPESDVSRTLRWTNAFVDARDFPALQPVREFAAMERQLYELVLTTAAEANR